MPFCDLNFALRRVAFVLLVAWTLPSDSEASRFEQGCNDLLAQIVQTHAEVGRSLESVIVQPQQVFLSRIIEVATDYKPDPAFICVSGPCPLTRQYSKHELGKAFARIRGLGGEIYVNPNGVESGFEVDENGRPRLILAEFSDGAEIAHELQHVEDWAQIRRKVWQVNPVLTESTAGKIAHAVMASPLGTLAIEANASPHNVAEFLDTSGNKIDFSKIGRFEDIVSQEVKEVRTVMDLLLVAYYPYAEALSGVKRLDGYLGSASGEYFDTSRVILAANREIIISQWAYLNERLRPLFPFEEKLEDNPVWNKVVNVLLADRYSEEERQHIIDELKQYSVSN